MWEKNIHCLINLKPHADEGTDANKGAYLITYVRYMLENYIKEDLCFINLLMVELCHWKCSILLTIS
jgi:hypothetical protein